MHHKIYWTTEMEAALIDLVAERPHLWDPRNKNYIRKNLRVESFLEIGAAMKERWPEHAQLFTHEGMANKFSILRSYFRREWKMAQKIRSRAGTEDFAPKWEHYARLSFLETVPVRKPKSRSVDVAAMDISDRSEDSDDTSPDSELDSEDGPGPSGRNLRLKLRPIVVVEAEPLQQTPAYQSSDESSSEDFTPVTNHYIKDIFQQEQYADVSLSPADMQRKNALDLAFCRYLNTMLSPIPDCLHKELAKIKITETILKMKFPLA